jgi:hypothetical protein
MQFLMPLPERPALRRETAAMLRWTPCIEELFEAADGEQNVNRKEFPQKKNASKDQMETFCEGQDYGSDGRQV